MRISIALAKKENSLFAIFYLLVAIKEIVDFEANFRNYNAIKSLIYHD